MNSVLQNLVPVATLILGYLLNVWVSSIESKRSQQMRRVADREKAYAIISSNLHSLFEAYRVITLNANLRRHISPVSKSNLNETINQDREDINTIAVKYDRLREVVFEQSLYLKPEILQSLIDLPLMDVRLRYDNLDMKTESEKIRFEEKHVDQLWSRAKTIMSQMRVELGLEPYPDEVLKMWR
jgi:hypothetical protein